MKAKSYLKYIAALLLFGSNGIIAGYITSSSYETVFLRTLIGSIFLLVIFLVTGGKFTFYKHKKQFAFLAVSGMAMGTSWMFLYEAYRQVGVSTASLAYYCGPVIVMALSPLLFNEKLTKTKLISFGAVIIGIIAVNRDALGLGSTPFGLFCGIMSAVMYSFMVIFNKKAAEIKGLENSLLQLVFSFLTVAVFVLIKEGINISIVRSEIPWILILGILNTGIGCYLYFSSIGYLPVQTVTACGYLEPLSAVILSALILGEPMNAAKIIGAVLIIGGAIAGELL